MPCRSESAWRLVALAAMLGLTLSACQTTTLVNGIAVAKETPRDTTSAAELRKRAQVRLELAAGYLSRGQAATAIDEAHQALSIDPNFAAAYGLLGLVYSSLGDSGQAELNFKHALELEPDNPDINNNYGLFLCSRGRSQDGLGHFDRAAANRLYDTPGLALQNAGICALQAGKLPVAESYLRRSFETDASSLVVKYYLARLYLQTKQLEKARFYYDLLQRKTEGNAESLFLGVRIARAGADQNEQQKLEDELRRRFPESPQAAALNRGDYDE